MNAKKPALFVLVLLALFTVPCAARAQQATLWDAARTPGARHSERPLYEASLHGWEATRLEILARRLPPNFPLAEAAQLRREIAQHRADARAGFERVLALDAQNVPALSALGTLLDHAGEPRGALPLLERARVAATRGAQPDPETAHVLFQLGVVYTRFERFSEAAEAYEAYARLPMDDETRGGGLCNLAETYGYLRELRRSIETYRACIDAIPARATGWWGLAVAFDRDARDIESLEAARNALLIDRELEDIDSPNVFYVPEYERHYYLAIAREAQGRDADALREWERYLAAGGPGAPWVERARAHRDRLARIAPARPTRSVRPPPPLQRRAN